jgi:outer membrane immunogenic protein
MKKLLLATVATIGLGGVASAADLAVKAPVALAPVDSWTGLYVGANIGGGLVNATIDDWACSLTCSSENFRKGAFTAGVTAGYNW